ncbi:MAG: AzlC family ABC transporter permease [Microthrixaceae bacterium]
MAEAPADPTRAGVLISLAVGIVGITFGVLARGAGLSLLQCVAMSALVFTGASQFAVVGIAAAGGSTVAALGAASLLAARNLLYGPVVARWLHGPRWQRLALAQLVIDESAGMGAAQPDGPRARRGFLVTGIGVFVCWNLGTVAGALAGDVIGDPERFGLDVAFPACFLALLGPHLRTLPGRVAALLGAGFALVAVPLVPVGVPILLSALAIVPAARVHVRVHGSDPT